MKEIQRYSKKNTPAMYLTVIVFSLFALSALAAFGYYAIDVSLALSFNREMIVFSKGAMYMLGVGLGAGQLVLFMMHELSGKTISPSYNKKATRYTLVFIGLIGLFPQIADYAVSLTTRSNGYIICKNQSYRWLHVQTIVYGINEASCFKNQGRG